MKAVVYDTFGGIDVLKIENIALSAPGPTEVQVEPFAVSVNPIDGKIRRGELKLMSGGRFPKRTGQDFSGVIRAVGSKVTRWKVGDEVYGCARGMKDGALGEAVNVPQDFVSARPRSVSHATAASLPMVALAAFQSFDRVAKISESSSVLVNGCTGGFGLIALQLAHKAGASTTGVCGADGLALAQEYGADTVIDYRSNNVATSPERFDVILELSGQLPFNSAHSLLKDRGAYIDVSPSPGSIIGNTLANPFRRRTHKLLLSKARANDLATIASYIDQGSLQPPPITTFEFEDFAKAYSAAEAGGVIGKIVVQVRPES